MNFSGNESFILCTHPLPNPAQSTSALPPVVSTINYNGSSSKQDTRLCVVASGIGLGVYNVSECSQNLDDISCTQGKDWKRIIEKNFCILSKKYKFNDVVDSI